MKGQELELRTARTITKRGKMNGRGSARLVRSRENLKHLIYFMQHDRSLNAQTSKIESLGNLLQSVEEQIRGMRPKSTPPRQTGTRRGKVWQKSSGCSMDQS